MQLETSSIASIIHVLVYIRTLYHPNSKSTHSIHSVKVHAMNSLGAIRI
jgi:hypothetical protein